MSGQEDLKLIREEVISALQELSDKGTAERSRYFHKDKNLPVYGVSTKDLTALNREFKCRFLSLA